MLVPFLKVDLVGVTVIVVVKELTFCRLVEEVGKLRR